MNLFWYLIASIKLFNPLLNCEVDFSTILSEFLNISEIHTAMMNSHRVLLKIQFDEGLMHDLPSALNRFDLKGNQKLTAIHELLLSGASAALYVTMR